MHVCPNKPSIFVKSLTNPERKVRVYYSSNQSEEFTFNSNLEIIKDTRHTLDKILRVSYSMSIHTFCGTAE